MTVSITRSEHTPADLRREAGRPADAPASRRMLSLALVMEGESRERAARQCGMDRQTLRDWVHRYNAMGVAGLFDRPHGGGASPKLTGMQEATLAEWVRAGPDLETDGVVRWRVIDLRQKIAQEFNVELHQRSVGKLLRRFVSAACQCARAVRGRSGHPGGAQNVWPAPFARGIWSGR